MSYENKLNVCLGFGSGGTNLGLGLGGVHPEGRVIKSEDITFLAVSILVVLKRKNEKSILYLI
tara:strand:- start:2166 stop:2354 length:189 start_codon:yes stop_codon:yes gene_type:complete